jgi:hypothetical protein
MFLAIIINTTSRALIDVLTFPDRPTLDAYVKTNSSQYVSGGGRTLIAIHGSVVIAGG